MTSTSKGGNINFRVMLFIVVIVGTNLVHIMYITPFLQSASIHLVERGHHQPTEFQPREELNRRHGYDYDNYHGKGQRQEQEIPAPKVVWLMTFPNSGTSYTIQMLRAYTNESTATNYGEEHMHHHGHSIPIHTTDDYLNGPFLAEQNKKKRPIGKYIMTKTHCGGRCSRCGPNDYMETRESFQTECLSGHRGFTHQNGTVASIKAPYNEKLVQKAVHLIRDPFDNIISRFHLTHKKMQKSNQTLSFVNEYPNNSTGFRKWCTNMDSKYKADHRRVFGKDLMKLLSKVPCHADFYRYIAWHNLAFQVVEHMHIPSMVFHYEDYEHDFNETKNKIITFMEMEEKRGAKKKVPFHPGKKYRTYFSKEEHVTVQELIKKLGSDTTVVALRRYF